MCNCAAYKYRSLSFIRPYSYTDNLLTEGRDQKLTEFTPTVERLGNQNQLQKTPPIAGFFIFPDFFNSKIFQT
jgi:hypothetical protein